VQKSGGRHRAAQSSTRRRTISRRNHRVPVAGIAAVGALVVGLTPSVANTPALVATVHYLPGTKIGDFRPEAEYVTFADAMIAGSGVAGGSTKDYIDYPAGFWPVSAGGLTDPTYDKSVDIGVSKLTAAHPGDGDVIFGYSQGAVVASKYKATDPNTNITYVLVENPNRPNGGILERFQGLYIPILDVSFDGATVDNGAPTVDISRQYDGWSDFPAYPLNVLATANAIAGIVYLHGNTQNFVDPAVLTDIKDGGDPRYYQEHGSTTYYVIPTAQLPILMPLKGIVPEPILDALDPPLRAIIESGYDRTDYSAPTPLKLIPSVAPAVPAAHSDSTVSGAATAVTPAAPAAPAPKEAAPKEAAPKVPAPKTTAPTVIAPKTTAPKTTAPTAPKGSRPPQVDSAGAATATSDRSALPKPVRAAIKALRPKKTTGASADTAQD
jgi:PE-PPE domain